MAKKKSPPLVRSDLLRYASGFPLMIDAIDREMAIRRRWAAQYQFAVSLILQIPGGADYAYDRTLKAHFWRHIWAPDPRPAAAILALALEQLDAPALLRDLPRAGRLAAFPLPRDVRYRLRQQRRPQTLLTAIDCLDRLLIAPVHPQYARHRDGCVRRPLPAERYPRFA